MTECMSAWVSKRTTVVLLAALVAASVVASPSPIRAVDGRPDHLAVYSACTGVANSSAGFLDVAGHFAEQGVNCLAYYGISVGKTANRYAPDDPITRWQMAMFLVRAAGPAGIDVPVAIDQGFQDIAHHAPHIQVAINQLATMGITRGTSPTTFHPDSPMDRRQMALFLYRFLVLAPTGPGGTDASQVIPDDDVFRDLGDQSESVVTAVKVMYEMGITVGVTATTFSPRTLLTRGQMALFVTRALAHTNSRPEGISIQSASPVISAGDTLEVQVSVRDAKFQPRTGMRIDIFSTSADDPYELFGADGTCQQGVQATVGARVCTIDGSDQQLDKSGNVRVVLQPVDNIRLWAWTGSQGSRFRLATTTAAMSDVQVLKPASSVLIADDMQSTAKALMFGAPIGFVFQLVDEDGRAVGEAGHRVQVSTTYVRNGVRDLTSVKTYRTDVGGRVTVSYQASDPDPSTGGDETTMDIDVSVQGLTVIDRSTLRVASGDGLTVDTPVTWSEQAPRATTLRLRQVVRYHELTGSGPGPVNVVTGVLTDQYGAPVAGESIAFSSDDGHGVGTAVTPRSTDQRGVSSLRYIWTGTEPDTETISAQTAGGVTARPMAHYWAKPQTEGRSVLGVPILVQDVTRNMILHDARSPKLVQYDDNDRLTVRGAPVRLEAFEEALYSGAYTRISYTEYSPDPAHSNTFDLSNTRQFEAA